MNKQVFGLSIIVASFNNPYGTLRLIKSIKLSFENFFKINGEYPNIEIIIADNSLNDKTKKILETSSLGFIKYISVMPLGVSYVRDYAIKRSRYSYISITDSDCVVDETWLNSIFNAIIKNKMPDVIQGSYFHPSDDKWTSLSESKWDRDRFYIGKQADGKNIIIKKRKYFALGGFNTKHFYSSGAESLFLMDRFRDINSRIIFDDNIIVFHKYPGLFGEMRRYQKFGKAAIHIKFERRKLFDKEFSPIALWKDLIGFKYGYAGIKEFLYRLAKIFSFTAGYFAGKKHYMREIMLGRIISPILTYKRI